MKLLSKSDDFMLSYFLELFILIKSELISLHCVFKEAISLLSAKKCVLQENSVGTIQLKAVK